jgi:hypothetical protein
MRDAGLHAGFRMPAGTLPYGERERRHADARPLSSPQPRGTRAGTASGTALEPFHAAQPRPRPAAGGGGSC